MGLAGPACMRNSLLAIMLVATSAHAEPILGVHAGGGISTNQRASGESSSLIVGGSLRQDEADRRWSPRFALDVRRIDGQDEVRDSDFASALDTRGIGVRALGGIRVHSRAAAIQWFGQLSVGVEWQRASWEKLRDGGGGRTEPAHESGVGMMFEPALGGSLRVGPLRAGTQLALTIQNKPTAMPVEIANPSGIPIGALLTAFVEMPL